MTPGKRPYICYRGRKYRDRERRLENTYREGDCVRVVDIEQEREPVTDAEQKEPVLDSEQRGPMADDTEAKQFGEQRLIVAAAVPKNEIGRGSNYKGSDFEGWN